MPTSWKRADDNVLRAHLQEALAQRAASSVAADWSYSDYELAAIRAELNERQLARIAQRIGVETLELSDARAGVACGSSVELPLAGDADAARLRMLIPQCFKPARQRKMDGGAAGAVQPAIHRLHGARDGSVRVFSRLQRLR